MPFGQHLDPAAVRGAARSALIAGVAAAALLAAPINGGAQDRAQNPGGDKNVTAEVKKKPAVPLPSLNPLVEEVLPAVVSISARLSGEAAAQADKSADEGDQRAPFDELLKRFFENRGMPQTGREVMALGSGFIIV